MRGFVAVLTKRAEPLESLVGEVRRLANEKEAILLLPSDPNLEACFDRPRPMLNCPVIFTDQYWLRYVNDDAERLKRDPPKIIIIGPSNNWRSYSGLRNNSGALEALIDQVQSDLLPAHYRLVDSHRINYRNGVDYLDVWVRTD